MYHSYSCDSGALSHESEADECVNKIEEHEEYCCTYEIGNKVGKCSSLTVGSLSDTGNHRRNAGTYVLTYNHRDYDSISDRT